MIKVKNLTRYYGESKVLDDVSMEVRKGEIVGLLGLNGAGKTTVMRSIVGLLPPSSGSISLDDCELSTLDLSKETPFGFLPESPPQYANMTVTAFLQFIGELHGMTRAKIEERILLVVQKTNLVGREHQVISTLSHGFRKRLGIAQTILHDPRVVVLDEPISGLDPVQIVEMRKVIRDLAPGRSVIISSHILTEIAHTCDRIIVLHQGQVMRQGNSDDMALSLSNSRLSITVRGTPVELNHWLEEHPLVLTAHEMPIEEPFASAIVTLNGDSGEDLIHDLVNDGFGIRIVSQPNDDLEEIFLGLTQSNGAEE